jgi:hypothetical protein
MVEGQKKALFDTDKMVAINLKKEECIVLIDKNELLGAFKKQKGTIHYKEIKEQAPLIESDVLKLELFKNRHDSLLFCGTGLLIHNGF